MRKTRNPRYAPEFLERRLHPSAMGVPPVTAVVAPSSCINPDEPPTYPPVAPTPTTDPSNPTAPIPTEPGGPYEPAMIA